MPYEGLILRITHTGKTRSSVFLSDISDGIADLANFRKAGPVYIPYLATVDMIYAGDVAESFDVGGIRGFINGGHLTAEFIIGDLFATSLANTTTFVTSLVANNTFVTALANNPTFISILNTNLNPTTDSTLVVEATASPYTVDIDEGTILVNLPTNTNPVVQLPPGATHKSGRIEVKDLKGTSNSFPITILPSAGETIDGLGSTILKSVRSSTTLVFHDGNWNILTPKVIAT